MGKPKQLTSFTSITTIILLVTFGVSLWAQQKGAKPPVKTEGNTAKSNKKSLYMPVVTIGRSGYSGGLIKADQFKSILKDGLKSQDSTGQMLKVVSFNFTYGERGFFEDSAGEIHMMMDLMSEFCIGDTISSNVGGVIYERVKAGDTIYFSQIALEKRWPKANKTDTFLGKSFKCAITK